MRHEVLTGRCKAPGLNPVVDPASFGADGAAWWGLLSSLLLGSGRQHGLHPTREAKSEAASALPER